MSADGFLAPRRTSAASLGVVIALHVGVLGAVILAKGPRMFAPPPVIQLIPIAPDAPPPPPLPAPPPTQRTTPQPRPTIPTPENATPQPDLTEITLSKLPDPGPAVPPLAEWGMAKPLPAPVLTDAAIDPRYAEVLQPPYPPALARAEIEGRVTVRVLVGTDGRVKAVEQVSADDPGFFAATETQARRYWRFRPATRDGVAIESWRTMSVRFTLQS